MHARSHAVHRSTWHHKHTYAGTLIRLRTSLSWITLHVARVWLKINKLMDITVQA